MVRKSKRVKSSRLEGIRGSKEDISLARPAQSGTRGAAAFAEAMACQGERRERNNNHENTEKAQSSRLKAEKKRA